MLRKGSRPSFCPNPHAAYCFVLVSRRSVPDVSFSWGLGSAAVEEVPEARDEPDGAAGGGEALAGREREAAEREVGAQQRYLFGYPLGLRCSLSVLLLLFRFLHDHSVTSRKKRSPEDC